MVKVSKTLYLNKKMPKYGKRMYKRKTFRSKRRFGTKTKRVFKTRVRAIAKSAVRSFAETKYFEHEPISNSVDYGLPDHLVEQSCYSVLERLRRNPQMPQTHRTGQRLVWDTFHRLLQTDYSILSGLVEFQDVT